MDNKTPATPATAATPGNNQGQPVPQPSGTVPPVATQTGAGGQAGNQDGKVLVDANEYRKLQRDAARTAGLQRRVDLFMKNPPQNTAGGQVTGDEDADKLIASANARAEAAERRSMQLEVTNRVKDLVNSARFKDVPESTKRLILKNPSALSDAQTLDEAILDIEDFLENEILSIGQSHPVTPQGQGGDPAGHETPPRPGSGAPSTIEADGDLVETEGLTGPERSRAVLRNIIKKAGRK